MKNQKKYNFIVPVYNEVINIEPTIKFVRDNFFTNDYKISFVDDNSPDGTAKKVIDLANTYPEIELLQHGKKIGLGAAVFFGYLNSKSEYVIGLDADLSQSPKYLKDMFAQIENGSDMVIGSRYISGGQVVGKSKLRLMGSIIMNKISSILLGLNINDISHTFRVFRREIIDKVSSDIEETGHPSFLIEFTYLAKKNNYKITEFPISFIERKFEMGDSKLSIFKEIFPFLYTVFKLYKKK